MSLIYSSFVIVREHSLLFISLVILPIFNIYLICSYTCISSICRDNLNIKLKFVISWRDISNIKFIHCYCFLKIYQNHTQSLYDWVGLFPLKKREIKNKTIKLDFHQPGVL